MMEIQRWELERNEEAPPSMENELAHLELRVRAQEREMEFLREALREAWVMIAA